MDGWSWSLTLLSGQTITSRWNASYSLASLQVIARNVGYNATIALKASVGIGFLATHIGNCDRPTSFTLNVAGCAVV